MHRPTPGYTSVTLDAHCTAHHTVLRNWHDVCRALLDFSRRSMHSARGELHMHASACGVAYCILIYLYIQECNMPCVLGMCAQLYGLLPQKNAGQLMHRAILGHRFQAEGPMKSHERPAEGSGFQTSRLQAVVCFEESAPRLHQARMISTCLKVSSGCLRPMSCPVDQDHTSGEECQCFSNLMHKHVHVQFSPGVEQLFQHSSHIRLADRVLMHEIAYIHKSWFVQERGAGQKPSKRI